MRVGLMSQKKLVGESQSLVDHGFHVHVPIGRQASQKGNWKPLWRVTELFGKGSVFSQKGAVCSQAFGIVGNIVGGCFLAKFAKGHGFAMVLPRRKVFVLVDARPGNRPVGVVDDGIALVVFCGAVNPFKLDGAIAEASFGVAEKSVERAGVEQVIETPCGTRAQVRSGELFFQMNGDGWVIEDAANDLRIALGGNSLIFFFVVVVVVVETNGETFQYRRREVFRMTPPLFNGVAFEEGLVKLRSEQFQSLFLEILRLADVGISQGSDEGLRLIGAHCFPEELIDRQQIDGHGEHAATRAGLDAVDEWAKVSEAIDVSPDTVIVGVENVRPVFVKHHPGFGIPLGMAIPCNMRTFVPNFDGTLHAFDELTPENGARKSGSYDKKTRFQWRWHLKLQAAVREMGDLIFGDWRALVVYGIDKLLKPNFLEILSVAGKKGFHSVGFQGDAQHNIVRLRC